MKSIHDILWGSSCCMQYDEPLCYSCAYKGIKDCSEVLHDDIYAMLEQGRIRISSDGLYEPADMETMKKVKTKRKNGRRYSDGERRKGRHEQYGIFDEN